MNLQDSIILHTLLIGAMGYSFYKIGIQAGINRAIDFMELEGYIELEAEG